MENFEIQHSLKDIPTPKNSEYLELLVDKVASFLRRFKWMAFFKLNPDVRGDPKEKYGFKSSYAPPQITQQNYGEHHSTLKAFENEVYCLVRRVEFNKYTNKYQEELKAGQGMPGAVTRASDSTIIVNGSKNGQPVVSSP